MPLILGDPSRILKKGLGRVDNAFASIVEQVGGRGVAADDIADAFTALWSAERLLAGTAQRLPEASATDAYGLPMHIWY